MLANRAHHQLSPIILGLNEATHQTHTDGDDHDIWAAPYVAPVAGRIIAMLYQVNVTIENDTIEAVIGLLLADHDGATNEVAVTDTATTLEDDLAAANLPVYVPVVGGQGYPVAAGQTIIANVTTAGTNVAAVAGSVRIFAVFQPAEM